MKLCVPFTEGGSVAFVADDQGYFGLATKGKRKDRPDNWEQFSWFPRPDQALRYALDYELANSDAETLVDLIDGCNDAFARLSARITDALEQIDSPRRAAG